eukprot:scaffold1225_cov164-Amphora_coffeaeformis.AAC.27
MPMRKLLAEAAARSVNKCANKPSASMARASLVLSNKVMARDRANRRCNGSVSSLNSLSAISRVFSFKAGMVTMVLVEMIAEQEEESTAAVRASPTLPPRARTARAVLRETKREVV